MGVFLGLDLAPHRISKEQWEAAYQDALLLVDRFDLMDRIITERSGERFAFTRKTAERELLGKGPGILVCGTMASGYDMEEFFLFRNLEYYLRPNAPDDNGVDMLFAGLYPEDSDIPKPAPIQTLWFDKTQGRPGHIPLLAISCLFADRFPDAVRLYGDITAGQCQAAVRLANQYLEQPIQTPITCQAEALAKRLRKTRIPIQKQLDAFFQLYLGTLTKNVGRILMDAFSQEALYCYFRYQLAQHEPGQHDFRQTLRDYLLLELDPSGLFRMLVSDTEGNGLPLEKALTTLFSYRVHVPFQEKNCYDPMALDSAVRGDEEAPHEIEALFGRLMFTMVAGRNRSIPVYLPLDTIREICRSLADDADELIDRLLAEQLQDGCQEKVYGNDGNSLINAMEEKARQFQADDMERQKYDIRRKEDIRHYRPGRTIYPALENVLIDCVHQIQKFGLEEDYQRFLALNRTKREACFIRNNRYILLYEQVWEHIFSRVMDDAYIRRYYYLFRVDCSLKSTFDLMDPLLNCPAMVDYLWEKVAAEEQEL